MLNMDYNRWEDYYKNNFLPDYSNFVAIYNDKSFDAATLECAFLNLFKTTCELVRIYMANKGVFKKKDDYRAIIREAYYREFLDNGQYWINIVAYINNPNDEFFLNNRIYSDDKYLHIFNDLNKKFEDILFKEGILST